VRAPGDTALTVMPYFSTSFAAMIVNDAMPDFAAP
jgi:hypothetical protein